MIDTFHTNIISDAYICKSIAFIFNIFLYSLVQNINYVVDFTTTTLLMQNV